MSKLQFSDSCCVKWSGRGMVSVPALPHRGFWAVTQVTQYTASITHIPTGEKIMDISNRRVGRMVCAVLNALPYDWQAWPKFAYEFKETIWFEWIKEVRSTQ
jgi:hypothetical protein